MTQHNDISLNTKKLHIDFATKVNMKTIDDLSKIEHKQI
jgi:hypothetical protein